VHPTPIPATVPEESPCLVFGVEGEAGIDIDADADADADVTELEEIIKLVVDNDVAVVFKVELGVEAAEVLSFVRW
jgi:hypothetical protein